MVVSALLRRVPLDGWYGFVLLRFVRYGRPGAPVIESVCD